MFSVPLCQERTSTPSLCMYLVVDKGADDEGHEEAACDDDDAGRGHRAAPPLIRQLADVNLGVETEGNTVLSGYSDNLRNPNFSRTVAGITKCFWATIEGYLSYLLPKFEDLVPTSLGSGAI